VAGDMFEAVPKADAYSLKMILTIGTTQSASRPCPTSGRRRLDRHGSSLSSTSCPNLTCRIFPSCSIFTWCAGVPVKKGPKPNIHPSLSERGWGRPAPITQPIARARLASDWLASLLPGESRTHWIAMTGFPSCYISSPSPGFILTRRPGLPRGFGTCCLRFTSGVATTHAAIPSASEALAPYSQGHRQAKFW